MTQSGHSAFSRFLRKVALQRLPMIVSRWGQSRHCGVHQRNYIGAATAHSVSRATRTTPVNP